jgi:holo-[acyl-carrier protein] synthase
MSARTPVMTTESRARIVESLRSETIRRFAPTVPTDARRHRAPGDADPGSLRVGIDLVGVAEVAESVGRLGRHYLYRVFTPHERACARVGADRSRGNRRPPGAGGNDIAGYSMESLAARFAAKEAALKVLRPVAARPEWRSIEVRRVEGGWCELRLTGLAADLAAEAGITTLAVSVTHEPMMAAACVVGTRRGGAPAWRRTSPPDRRGK